MALYNQTHAVSARKMLSSVATLALLVGLQGCGGGGGVNSTPAPTPAPSPTPTPTPTPTPSTATLNIVSGPERATFGTTTPTTAAQGYNIATVSSQLAAGQVFALQQSATSSSPLGGTSLSVAADSATNAAGATITVVSPGPVGADTPTLQLKVPNLGIDQQVVFNSTTETLIASGPLAGKHLYVSGSTELFDYLGYGSWLVYDSTETVLLNSSPFITGFHTPNSAMPSSGTATYSGSTRGQILINGGQLPGASAVVRGNGELTANFATNSVSGTLTNMVIPSATSSSFNWNNVSLSGTISGSSISGTSGVASTVSGSSLAFSSGATGTIAGGFFGPQAEELGLIWTLRDANGSSAIGIFGATRP